MNHTLRQLTLEEFRKTRIGRKVPPVTRLIASKLESGDAPEAIGRALGISTDIVNCHIKIIRRFPCQPLDEDFMEEAVAARENPAPPPHPDSQPMVDRDRGTATQRAKVHGYLDSPMSAKLSADVRKQLRMWADGASQKEVARKLGVDQGNFSRRIKAVLNEIDKAARAWKSIMLEAEQEEVLEKQRREAALQEAVAAGDKKQINKLLSSRARSDDAIAHTSTGGKTHERWAISTRGISCSKG